MGEKKKIRITSRTIVIMGVVAFFYDSLQALTTAGVIGIILSSLITAWAWLHFYVWFKIKGVSFFEGKLGKILARRLAPFIAPMIFELIPGFNVVPGITLGIILTASLVYLEDKAVEKGVISEEDLKAFQKYLSKHKGILVGNIHKEDLEMLYRYGEERVGQKLQNSPKAEKIAHIANTVSRDIGMKGSDLNKAA